MEKRKYPTHPYNKQVKRVCLSRVGKRKSGKKSVDALVKKGAGPSRSTIYRWLDEKNERRGPKQAPKTRGRKSRLSEGQRLVVGGWIIHRGQERKLCQGVHILSFVKKAFGQTFSHSWVTKTCKRLHLGAHRPKVRKRRFVNTNLSMPLYQFLKDLRETIEEKGLNPTRVVAIDTVRFTKPDYPLSTYSIQGAGQPSIAEEDYQHKVLLYEGLVMDGSVLPPVIFTNYAQIPQNIEGEQQAFVFFVPGLSQPTADLTLRWLDTMREYLGDNPLVIHDRGPEFIAGKVQEEFKNQDITSMSFPAMGGAFINPCDNSFNAQLKRHYFHHNRETFTAKLEAVISAYFSSSEEQNRNYFHHVRWCGEPPTRSYVEHLLQEGFRPVNNNEKIYGEMLAKYRAWKKGLRI